MGNFNEEIEGRLGRLIKVLQEITELSGRELDFAVWKAWRPNVRREPFGIPVFHANLDKAMRILSGIDYTLKVKDGQGFCFIGSGSRAWTEKIPPWNYNQARATLICRAYLNAARKGPEFMEKIKG